MTIYRYYCIVCGFVSHTVKSWHSVAAFYECPSCHKQVECRQLPEVSDVQQNEGKTALLN